MNQRLFEALAERFRQENGVDVRSDRMAAARLLEAAEIAKIELSANTTTHISLPFLTTVGGQARHFEADMTRTELERLVRPVIEQCRRSLEQALHDASVGARDIDRVVFVGGPTRMPAVRGFFEELLGRPAEMGVDPMECVACGAAIQAGVLSGEVGNIVLVDVTPLTLGVETLGGVATPLIARNTPVPAKRAEFFTTAADMQTSVTIHVFQGERPMAADNTSLGEFVLAGLPPAPRGIPKIEVTFDIDANGILSVAAKDTATGRSQSIRISGSTRLSEEDKRRMIDDAERYAEADRRRREEADKLNAADAVCYQAERTLADFAEKLPAELRQRLEASLRDTRTALSQRDATLATERAEALKRILQEAGGTLYTQTTQAQPQPQPHVGSASGEARPSGSGPRGRVVDAEYHEQR
jgi:molecular chaperone DnaK